MEILETASPLSRISSLIIKREGGLECTGSSCDAPIPNTCIELHVVNGDRCGSFRLVPKRSNSCTAVLKNATGCGKRHLQVGSSIASFLAYSQHLHRLSMEIGAVRLDLFRNGAIAVRVRLQIFGSHLVQNTGFLCMKCRNPPGPGFLAL